MPFLDSIGGSDEHGPEKQALVRPWQSYWPPEEGSELHDLLKQKVPEVLTWRFDPKKPFDRPWQAWAKQAVLSGRVCVSTVLPPRNVEKTDRHPGTAQDGGHHQPGLAGLSQIQPTTRHRDVCADRQRRVQELDAEIEALSLPFTVPSQFNYLADDSVYETNKPYHTRLPFMGEIRRSNLVAQGYSGVKIHDLGGHQDNFTLDKSGFQYVKAPVSITKWTNESAVDQYLPAMETWLKQFFHASRVEIITYTFRCADSDRTSTESWIGPYMRAHCDATLNSGLRRLNLHLPDEAEEIKKGRWRMIGLWRALTGPHQDRPLAVLDGRSLCQDDLVGADVVFPHYCDEGYEVRYSPLHRWFYKQCMTPDDALILKLYDSVEGGVRFCPHAAFVDSLVPDGTPQRASIEIRAIIID